MYFDKLKRVVRNILLAAALLCSPSLASAETYQNLYKIGDVQVPLPPGQWEVAGTGAENDSAFKSIGQVVLVSITDRQLTGIIRIDTPIGHSAMEARFSGFEMFRPCERNDVFFVFKTYNISGGEQNCWTINHFSMGTSGKVSASWAATLDLLKSRGVTIPITMVIATFRMANKTNFETVWYFFNPEIEGISPPKYADWRSSDWHKDRVDGFPDKLAYLTKTKEWAEQWHALIEKGFTEDLPAADAR